MKKHHNKTLRKARRDLLRHPPKLLVASFRPLEPMNEHMHLEMQLAGSATQNTSASLSGALLESILYYAVRIWAIPPLDSPSLGQDQGKRPEKKCSQIVWKHYSKALSSELGNPNLSAHVLARRDFGSGELHVSAKEYTIACWDGLVPGHWLWAS